MDYLLDTNILLAYIRQNEICDRIDSEYNPLCESCTPVISVVTVGEIKSIGIRNKWGKSKLNQLDTLLGRFLIADINVKSIITKYSEIDNFSQKKDKNSPTPFTSRKLGKNDLWIAATASVLEIPLLTTDRDFVHLDN